VCSMFFDHVSRIYSDVVYMSLHIPGSMCVDVTLWFGWGGVVSVCRLRHYYIIKKHTTHKENSIIIRHRSSQYLQKHAF